MASFYDESCKLDARATIYGGKRVSKTVTEDGESKLRITTVPGKKVTAPQSIINENSAIDYRTIYNGFNILKNNSDQDTYTLYSDYERCISDNAIMREYLNDAKNPTIDNILKYYNGESNQFDPHGLARYKLQDFIFCSHFGMIPNNQMITLRRYSQPCPDHMFGFDLEPKIINKLNNYPDNYFCMATAVTWMGEQTGNNMNEILHFSYGQKYEEKQSSVESLQNPDGGLAAQLAKFGVAEEFMAGQGGENPGLVLPIALAMSGKTVDDMIAARNSYDGDAILQAYGDGVIGPTNRIDSVTVRAKGLTFSQEFAITFEYDLKSIQMLNPKVTMLDILSNFMILSGNYGTFWGGETRWYGSRNIAPAFGDPSLFRQGKAGSGASSMFQDMMSGWGKFRSNYSSGFGGTINALWDIACSGFEGVASNFLGENLAIQSSVVIPKALLSGEPSGMWHMVIGNPLNPIAVIGNLCLESTDVEFSDALGYDDFPSKVKFTVHLKHGLPRDIGAIQAMFNGGKGRIYHYIDEKIENALNYEESHFGDQFADGGPGKGRSGKGGDGNPSAGSAQASGNSPLSASTGENNALSTAKGYITGLINGK